MAEYIEKAELIKKLCFETAEWYYSPTIKTIKEFPSTDVQPVKHGKWIYVGSVRSWDEIKCSACNSAFSTEDRDLILNWDFCPHCGARMDAEPDEPWQSE